MTSACMKACLAADAIIWCHWVDTNLVSFLKGINRPKKSCQLCKFWNVVAPVKQLLGYADRNIDISTLVSKCYLFRESFFVFSFWHITNWHFISHVLVDENSVHGFLSGLYIFIELKDLKCENPFYAIRNQELSLLTVLVVRVVVCVWSGYI